MMVRIIKLIIVKEGCKIMVKLIGIQKNITKLIAKSKNVVKLIGIGVNK